MEGHRAADGYPEKEPGNGRAAAVARLRPPCDHETFHVQNGARGCWPKAAGIEPAFLSGPVHHFARIAPIVGLAT